MIITVVAGLILAAVAFLKPALAEAGVIVRARAAVAVAPDSPRGVIVQTGPRSYRCDIRVRPLRPLYGRFFWVPGHYEEILQNQTWQVQEQAIRVPLRQSRQAVSEGPQARSLPGNLGAWSLGADLI